MVYIDSESFDIDDFGGPHAYLNSFKWDEILMLEEEKILLPISHLINNNRQTD